MKRFPPIRRRFLLLVALAGCAASAPTLPGATPVLANRQLDELSGLARSPRGDALLWAHNDSGDTPRLFRVGLDGGDLGEVAIRGARAIDWEDIAAFNDAGTPSLLIADTGDNSANRPFVTLYAIAEPPPDASVAELRWKVDFTYPDGPRDAEALAVDPADGAIYVLSKRTEPPVLYRVPRGDGKGRVLAERLGAIDTLPAFSTADLLADPIFGRFRAQPTAMDISADGRRLAVMNYKAAYFWTRAPEETWIEALKRAPQVESLAPMPQAEGATLLGERLYYSSERLPAALKWLPLPPP